MIAIVQWQGLTCMLTPNVQMYSEYRGFLSQVGSSTSLMRPQVREMKRMGKERYSATYMEKKGKLIIILFYTINRKGKTEKAERERERDAGGGAILPVVMTTKK